MANDKRYYWIKLDNDFFDDDTIVWIEEQENGVLYVNFYLKLLLKSVTEQGRLVRYIGNTLVPYDDKALAKLTNTPLDTVRVAMELFFQIGLIEKIETGELYLTQIAEMIGSETDTARRVRKHRAKEEAQKQIETLQCNTDVTEMKPYIDIELDIELDKELIPLSDESDTSEAKIPIHEILCDEFWKAYPNKTGGKKKCIDYYKKFKDKQATHNLIMEDLKRRKEYAMWIKENGKYIPMAKTYLYNQQWLDEYQIGSENNATNGTTIPKGIGTEL